MELFLEILDGPLKGARTQLADGLTIGRKACDVSVDDPKVSSKHARLEERPDGTIWLIDLGSANGIRVDGKREDELALTPGTTFRLGRTRFAILLADQKPAVGLQTQVKNVFKKARRGVTAEKSWREHVIFLSERVIREAEVSKRKPEPLVPLPSPIRLSFKRGIQSGTEWTLGYAPRDIGSWSVDLPLFEPGLPPRCFRLVVQDGEAVLRTSEEALGKIFLNGKRVESAFLRPGDVIEIGNTQIVVSFES